MPALRDTIAAPERRDPITAIRVELAKAEADLNGLVARIAAGHLDIAPAGTSPVNLARKISRRVYALRNALDEARFALLPFETVNGFRLCPNDEDDMGDALHHALDRLRLGIDDTAEFRTPQHAADVARGSVPPAMAAAE